MPDASSLEESHGGGPRVVEPPSRRSAFCLSATDAAEEKPCADKDGAGTLVVSFDVPTNLGGAEYFPGRLVRWSGSGFGSHSVDGTWPPYEQLRDFSFVPAAGAVPDGSIVPGAPLSVSRAGSGLVLAWSGSCRTGDSDYEIYEGVLGSYCSHAAKFCTTEGIASKTFPMSTGGTYYLIVPKNALREGSYGRRSTGAEIPRGAGACLAQEIAASCP